MQQPNTTTTFDSGSIRSATAANENPGSFPALFHLLSPVAARRIAEAYGEGWSKYPPGNWTLGIPESSLMQHVFGHLYAYMAGDTTEDHLGHAAWNLCTLMHFQELRPELLDLAPVREGHARKTVAEAVTPEAAPIEWEEFQGDGVTRCEPDWEYFQSSNGIWCNVSKPYLLTGEFVRYRRPKTT